MTANVCICTWCLGKEVKACECACIPMCVCTGVKDTGGFQGQNFYSLLMAFITMPHGSLICSQVWTVFPRCVTVSRDCASESRGCCEECEKGCRDFPFPVPRDLPAV